MIQTSKKILTIDRLSRFIDYIKTMSDEELKEHYAIEKMIHDQMGHKDYKKSYFRIYDEEENELKIILKKDLLEQKIRTITIPWLVEEKTFDTITFNNYHQFLIKCITEYRDTAYEYFIQDIKTLIENDNFYNKICYNYVPFDQFFTENNFTFNYFISFCIYIKIYKKEDYVETIHAFIKKMICSHITLEKSIFNLSFNDKEHYNYFLNFIRYYVDIDDTHTDDYYIDLLEEKNILQSGTFYGSMPEIDQETIKLTDTINYLSHIAKYSSIPSIVTDKTVQQLSHVIVDTLAFNQIKYDSAFYFIKLLKLILNKPSIQFTFTKQVKKQIADIIQENRYIDLMPEKRYFLGNEISPNLNQAEMKQILLFFNQKMKKGN